MCSLFCKCNECAAALCAGTGSTGDAPRIGRGTSQSQTIQRGRQQTPLRVVALAPRVPIPRHHHVRATAVRLAIAKPMNAASGAMTDSHDRGRAHGRRLTGHGLHHTAARHHPTATIGPHRCARSGQSTYCFRHPPLFTHFFTLLLAGAGIGPIGVMTTAAMMIAAARRQAIAARRHPIADRHPVTITTGGVTMTGGARPRRTGVAAQA